MMYRATFATKAGAIRRMTFACRTPAYARAYAESFTLPGESLTEVQTLRELARPSFELQSNLSGV